MSRHAVVCWDDAQLSTAFTFKPNELLRYSGLYCCFTEAEEE